MRMTRWTLPQRVMWAKAPGTADGKMRRPRAPLPMPSDFGSGMAPTDRLGTGGRKIVPTLQRLGRLCPPYDAVAVLAAVTAAAAAFAQAPAPPTDAEILGLMK